MKQPVCCTEEPIGYIRVRSALTNSLTCRWGEWLGGSESEDTTLWHPVVFKASKQM